MATSNANNPFSMNQGRTLLEGTLQVTDTAITADGAIEWSDAKLTSEDFTLTDKDIMASSEILKLSLEAIRLLFLLKMFLWRSIWTKTMEPLYLILRITLLI